MQYTRSTHQTVIRLVQGEHIDDANAIHNVLSSSQAGELIALSPTAPPDMQTLAALSRTWVRLVGRSDIESPLLQTMMRRMIATDLGRTIVESLAMVAPTGWQGLDGIDLMKAGAHGAWGGSIAALLGPNDGIIPLLTPQGAAFAVQRWGQTFGGSAWTDHAPSHVYDDIMRILRSDPRSYAASLPWLPDRDRISSHVAEDVIGSALLAYACADDRIRQSHADTIEDLVQRTDARHLGSLALLAKATNSDALWSRIAQLLRSPDADIGSLFRLMPFRDIPKHIAADAIRIIEEHVRLSPKDAHALDLLIACTRSLSLHADAWEYYDRTQRHELLRKIPTSLFPLAVRSLGPRADVLTYAQSISNDLIDAVSPYVHHRKDMVRWTLMPIALRGMTIADAHDVIAALRRMPPDPVAFFQTASKLPLNEAIDPGMTDALRSVAHLAAAVTMNNIALTTFAGIDERCAALHAALQGVESSDISRMAVMLPAFARDRLYPDVNNLADRMAPPNGRERMLNALRKAASLPPACAVQTLLVCSEGAYRTSLGEETLARVLRDHGETFLVLCDALDETGCSLLPTPSGDADAAIAVRNIARIDPLVAYHMAQEIRTGDMFFTRCAILSSSPDSAASVIAALPDNVRSSLFSDLHQRIVAVAAAGQEENLLTAVKTVIRSDPVVALALAAVTSEEPEERDAGFYALLQRPDICSRLLPFMAETFQLRLRPSEPMKTKRCR